VHLRELIKRYGSQPSSFNEKELLTIYKEGHFESTEPIESRSIMTLDEDVSKALIKMERLDQLTGELPGLDCGACGSPSCRALAEDIIRGIAVESDCVIKLRERIKTFAQEILDLARIVPPAMADSSKSESNKK
jgi:ArsR family metal-binding transcriptional regulator